MNNLTVSVIISSYNYDRFIGETIESVLAQTRPADEVIVVDDGSTDNSTNVIRSFGPPVTLITQKNQGVCKARNVGAGIAKGEILVFLDSDDLWRPEKLARQVDAFAADPEVGLVSCGLRYFDETGNTIIVYDKGKSGWCAKDIILFREPVLSTTASAIAVRKDVFEAVGGFDERRELFSAEDLEFCYRASAASKLAFIPEVLVDYRIHGANGHLNIKRMDRALRFAYEKIFAEASADIQAVKRESYGNLYCNLAGSHFRAGNYGWWVANTVKGLFLTPSNIRQFVGYPGRLYHRKRTLNNGLG
jgi:glycosyltransferase involved in cell wall biosynthesis